MKMMAEVKNKIKPYLIISFLVLLFLFLQSTSIQPRIIFPDLLNFYLPWADHIEDLPYRYSHLKSDFVDFYFPNIHLVKSELIKGIIPLWDDVRDLGKPMSHIAFQLLFTPFNLFIWFIPEEIGFTISIILKIIFSAFGMFKWLESFSLNKFLALTLSVVFVFSGFNSAWLMSHASTANMLIPWAFLLVDKIHKEVTQEKRAWEFLALSFIFYLTISTGFFAVAGYIIYLASFYILILVLIDISKIKTPTLLTLWRTISPGLLVFGSIIVAFGLSAFILLPSIEWTNVIDITYRKLNNSMSFLPLKTMILLVFPNYYGNPALLNWRGPLNWNETCSYVTILVIICVPIGLVYSIRKKMARAIIIAFLGLACGLIIWRITPLLDLVRQLPVFDTSSNTRLLGPLTFFLITIGGIGLQNVLEVKRSNYVYSYLVSIFISMLLLLLYIYLNYEKPSLLTTPISNIVIFRMVTVLLGFVLCLIYFLCFVVWRNRTISEHSFIMITCLILFVDLYYFNFRQTPMVPKDHYYPNTEISSFLQNNLGSGRVLTFDNIFMISGTQAYYKINSALTHNFHTEREKEIVNYLSENIWATPTAPLLKSNQTNFDSPMFDFLGIKYVVVPSNVELDELIWKIVLDNPVEGRVYENIKFIEDKYWFSSNYKQLQSLEQFDESLEHVVKREVIFIEPKSIISQGMGTSNAEIKIIKDAPTYNELLVCTDKEGVLTTRESYWPGWNGYINDLPTDVFRANYIYRGIMIDPGCHTVIEKYEPSSVRNGTIISLITLGCTFLLSFFVIYSRKTSR